MIKRLEKFIQYKGLKISEFERLIGVSNGLIGKAIKNEKGLGSDKIEKILSVFPELNAEWLLTGRGEMLKSSEQGDNSSIINKHNIINGGTYTIIGNLEAQNEKLMQALLDCQKKLQEAKDKIIQLLEERNQKD